MQQSNLEFSLARQALVLLIAVLLLGACQALPPSHADWTRTELFFGLDTPDGEISADQWQSFVLTQVSPRLPGFTVLDGRGYWTDDAGRQLSEKSRVVVYLHRGTGQDEESIEQVRRSYLSAFDQQSVLRVDSAARARFD